MLTRIRWLSGPVLDPKFHQRSKTVKFISINLYVPYLQLKTSKLKNLNLLHNQALFKSAIKTRMSSTDRTFYKLRIISAFGLPIQEDKLIITPALANNPGFNIKKIESRLMYSFDTFTCQIGRFATNFTQLPYNFYHFITDYFLPFMAERKKFLGTILFLPFLPTGPQKSLLEWFKIPFVTANFQANHLLDNVTLLTPIFHGVQPKSQGDNQLGYRFNYDLIFTGQLEILKALKFSSQDTGTRIFVSRKNSARAPNNLCDIENLFIRSGFSVYNAEDFDIEISLRLFNSAEIIIGFHGAGLTNMIFANPGTKIVELQPETAKIRDQFGFRPVFRLLAEACKHDYECREAPRNLSEWQGLVKEF